VLTFDEARRIVVNVAKLPALPAAWRLRTTGFGIVRANSFTLPKRQNRISWRLILPHFSGSI
jgi:hypothetical protein